MTRISGRATRPRPLIAIGMALAALALTTGGVAAAPPAAFTVSPTSVSFGSVLVNTSSGTQTVTVTTGRKDVVLEVRIDNGQFVNTGTGTCLTDFGYQVPANSTCTIDLAFTPLTAHLFSATMAIASCMKWHPDLFTGLPSCDMSHFSVSVSLDGTGLDLP
jgi:hypothetical protein